MSEVITLTISHRLDLEPILYGLLLTYQVEHWQLKEERDDANTYEIFVTSRL